MIQPPLPGIAGGSPPLVSPAEIKPAWKRDDEARPGSSEELWGSGCRFEHADKALNKSVVWVGGGCEGSDVSNSPEGGSADAVPVVVMTGEGIMVNETLSSSSSSSSPVLSPVGLMLEELSCI